MTKLLRHKSISLFCSIPLLMMAGLCSCSLQSSATNERLPSFRLEIIDHPKQKHFEIALQSLDARRLCINIEGWPNSNGNLHFGSTWVTLETPSGILPARDDNFGYALGGHGRLIIEPGSRLTAFIPYQNFGDPDAISAFPERKLHFEISPRIYHGD